MGHRGSRFVLAVLLFVALFGVPWPAALSPLAPATYGPWQQWLIGTSIIALHSMSGRRKHGVADEEDADASYFLGFIMTLLFLVFGLMKSQGGIDAQWVAGLIRDLGVGLGFTVVGLTVRQLEVLRRASGAAAAEPARAEPVAPDIADRITTQVGAVQAAAERIEESLAGVSRPVRELARERMAGAVIGFETRVGEATSKLGAAIDDLTAATVRSAVEIEGASSKLRSALQHDLEALEKEVASVVGEVARGRERLFEILRTTAAQAEETQRLVAVTARTQAAEWEEHCRGTFSALEQSSGALLSLSEAIVHRTNQLPDPSARLHSLWGTIGAQEDAMVASIERASGALGSLERASLAATEQMGRLDEGAAQSALGLAEGTGAVRATLAKEVQAMHRLVDELYEVIEGRINLVGRH